MHKRKTSRDECPADKNIENTLHAAEKVRFLTRLYMAAPKKSAKNYRTD